LKSTSAFEKKIAKNIFIRIDLRTEVKLKLQTDLRDILKKSLESVKRKKGKGGKRNDKLF
jgi:hypothetical protein